MRTEVPAGPHDLRGDWRATAAETRERRDVAVGPLCGGHEIGVEAYEKL